MSAKIQNSRNAVFYRKLFSCTANCFSAIYVGGGQRIRCLDVGRYQPGCALRSFVGGTKHVCI